MLAAALALAPAAYADDRCGGVFHPCASINLVSEPVGAMVTATDKWGVQACTAPCALPLREASSVYVEGKIDGYSLLPHVAPRWVYHYKVFGHSGYVLAPDPLELRFAKTP